jgi:AraC family transcriptional regulator, regulatory protein of adaptative response / methylated-DNA-[protein]-cysteine methyltransferase
MKAFDDARDEESVVTAGRVAAASTYCLASIGESTMEIKFTTGATPLGSVLVAATDKGVCAVSLRESDAGAEEHLRARFPKAELKRDDAALKPALDTVRERIAGRKLDGALPLDLQGTDFQRQVWSQLLLIPPGKTRSYLDVAQAINRPKATRAVAQACGANPVAVVVPCHRVVMNDGSIGGYSGLPGVKKALLAAEGVEQPTAAN